MKINPKLTQPYCADDCVNIRREVAIEIQRLTTENQMLWSVHKAALALLDEHYHMNNCITPATEGFTKLDEAIRTLP